MTVSGVEGSGARYRAYLPWIVAFPFTVSGVIHLVHPSTFTGIVPHLLPWPTALVYLSGLAELICAIGLWRRDRWAGIAAAAVLVMIWPANLQDSITTQQGNNTLLQVLLWLRLPVQIPLIWLGLQSGRDPVQTSASYRHAVDLHGSVLRRLGVDWESGVLSMDLRAAEVDVVIHATGLRKLSVVWAFPGADSKPIERVDVGHEKLSIEMQGGGHIRVEAASIEMP